VGGPALDPLPREQILEGMRRFPVWSYPFDLGQGIVVTPTETPLGPKDATMFLLSHKPKWDAVLGTFGGSLEGLTVLDAGCYQGYWTVEAARRGAARAVGFDARPEHLEQARFAARAIGLPNASFEQADVFDIERFGPFDVVLLFGILYHVDSPIDLLRRVRKVTRRLLVVDTNVLPLDEPVIQLRYEDTGMVLNSASAPLVAVPSVSAVTRMLRHTGFGDVRVVPPAPGGFGGRLRWKRAAFLCAPRDPSDPEPPPPEVIAAMKGRLGERRLSGIPSAADRIPLGTILGRKIRRLFDPHRPPSSEAGTTGAGE
jgi:SAM-dependent methyltransferase